MIEKKARRRKIAGRTFTYLFLAFWAIMVLFPFYWMILTSLKSTSAYNSEFVPKFFTLAPTLENYGEAFSAVPLARYFLNTLIFTLATTALMLVVIVLAAYALARLDFKGKNLVFTFFLALMMAGRLPMLKKHIDFWFPVCYEEEGQKFLSAGNEVETVVLLRKEGESTRRR